MFSKVKLFSYKIKKTIAENCYRKLQLVIFHILHRMIEGEKRCYTTSKALKKKAIKATKSTETKSKTKTSTKKKAGLKSIKK